MVLSCLSDVVQSLEPLQPLCHHEGGPYENKVAATESKSKKRT